METNPISFYVPNIRHTKEQNKTCTQLHDSTSAQYWISRVIKPVPVAMTTKISCNTSGKAAAVSLAAATQIWSWGYKQCENTIKPPILLWLLIVLKSIYLVK